VWYVLLAYFSYLMVLITVQYIPMNFQAGFLAIKQDVIGERYYQVAFFSHVYASMFALLPGFIQFNTSIRQHYPRVHRICGYIYISVIVLISAPSGFIMGYHANGGWMSSFSFMLLSVLWTYFTVQSFLKIKQGNIQAHRRFMWRSYALTLSAISLRLWKWVIASTIEPSPMDTYRLVAWLGWIGNLLLVEWWLRRNKY
jgi:uncharacterized membrane protein